MVITAGGRTAGAGRTLWHHRDYQLYWWARAVSVLGSQVSYAAVPLFALQAYRSPLAAALVTACTYGAALLFALHAGLLGDLCHRKTIMVGCDLGRTGLMALLAWAAVGTPPPLWLVCAVALVVGALGVAFDSAARAALPDLVEPALLPRALARNQSRDFTIALAGPVLGAWLLVHGAPWAFAVDAASYLVSAVLVGLVSASLAVPPVRARVRQIVLLREGLRFVARDRVLRQIALYLSALSLILTASVFAVIAFYAATGSVLSAGAALAAQAAGGFVGSLLAERLYRAVPPTLVAVLQGLAWAACLATIAAEPDVVLACLALAAVWLITPCFRLAFRTHVATNTPSAMRGRVNSVVILAGALFSPAGPIVAGVLTHALGHRAALLALAGFALAATVALVVVPHLRRPFDWRTA